MVLSAYTAGKSLATGCAGDFAEALLQAEFHNCKMPLCGLGFFYAATLPIRLGERAVDLCG